MEDEMIFDFFGELNWLAIVVATIAWFAFSAIWYSVPPLSKAWQKASKVDMTTEALPLCLSLARPSSVTS